MSVVVSELRALGVPVEGVRYVSVSEGCQFTHSYPGERYGWFRPMDGGEVMLLFSRDVTREETQTTKEWFDAHTFQSLGLKHDI